MISAGNYVFAQQHGRPTAKAGDSLTKRGSCYEAVDSSKNKLSHMYVAVIYLLVQKLVLLETSALVKLQVNLSCSSLFTELADEFIQNLDNLQSF